MIELRLKLIQISRESDEERFERAYKFFKKRMTQLLLELKELPLGPSESHIFPTEFTGNCWHVSLLSKCCERFMTERVTDLKVYVIRTTGTVTVSWSPEAV